MQLCLSFKRERSLQKKRVFLFPGKAESLRRSRGKETIRACPAPLPTPPLAEVTGSHQRNTSCNALGALCSPLLQTAAAREEPRKKVTRQEDAPERQISRWRALPYPVPAESSLFVSPVLSPTTGSRGDQNISKVILHPPFPNEKCNNATSVSTRLLQRCLINTLFLRARSWQERAVDSSCPSLPSLPPPLKLVSSIQLQFGSSDADTELNVTRPEALLAACRRLRPPASRR